jgi:hypothetical protein
LRVQGAQAAQTQPGCVCLRSRLGGHQAGNDFAAPGQFYASCTAFNLANHIKAMGLEFGYRNHASGHLEFSK